MATCANCIHHSCLCDYNTNISGNGKVRLVYAEEADVKCSFFQNTADVVPKREYDNLKMQFDALDRECDRLEKAESEKHDKIIEAKAEVAREIVDDILSKIRTMIKEIEKVEKCGNSYYSEFNGGSKTALEIVFKDIAELKKKYIPKDCRDCRFFVGCEQAVWTGPCDAYKEVET